MGKWFNNILQTIAEINTTSTRILVSVGLAIIATISVLVMMFLQIKIEIAVLGALFAFIVSLGGLDVIQYKVKRESYVPDPASTTDISATVSNRAIGTEHGIEFTE